MAEIVIRDLRKDFGDFTAVKSSSFKVEDGEFFMLLGPSGCGKTTTLRMIAGLELPTSGEIYIDGEEVGRRPASQRDIAFVFQMFALYPHMNVRRNIAYPLVSQGMPRAQVKAKVEEVARILGIEALLNRPVGGLSGGDRQRVALGRAIVRQPKAFMMDEPLGALDAEFRERMAEELRALHDRMGATTVYVTHDQLEAMQMGDKIVVMNHGVIEQFGLPQDIYDKPASMFVADFIGSPPMNFLRFQGHVHPGDTTVRLHHHVATIPEMRGSPRRRPGVRPSGRACAADRRRRLSRRGDRHRIPRHHADRHPGDAERRAEGAHPRGPAGGARGDGRPFLRRADRQPVRETPPAGRCCSRLNEGTLGHG